MEVYVRFSLWSVSHLAVSLILDYIVQVYTFVRYPVPASFLWDRFPLPTSSSHLLFPSSSLSPHCKPHMENFLHIGFTAVFRIRPVGKQGQTVHKQSLNRKKEWARERMLHTVHRCISENKAQKKKISSYKKYFFLGGPLFPPPPLSGPTTKKILFCGSL